MYANMFNTQKQEYTFFIAGRPTTVSVNDPRFPKVDEIMDKYHQMEYSDDSDMNGAMAMQELDIVLSKTVSVMMVEAVEEIVEDINFEDLRLTVNSDGTFSGTYKGIVLPNVLTQKFYDMYKDGCKNFDMYFKFIDNILKNPRESVREELYDFLAAESLPINDAGNFIAYKGVREDMYSVTGSNRDSNGNFTTNVIQGVVDNSGRILNSIGSTIRVRVTDVCDDRSIGCAQGLHVGSYSYASGFGNITLAVEVNPMNVISVPTDCSCQKCRVSEYTVKNIVERRYETPTVDEKEDGTVVETQNEKRDILPSGRKVNSMDNTWEIISAIQTQVQRNGGTTIRQLRGSVGRKFGLSTGELVSIIGQNPDNFKMVTSDRGTGFTEVYFA